MIEKLYHNILNLSAFPCGEKRSSALNCEADVPAFFSLTIRYHSRQRFLPMEPLLGSFRDGGPVNYLQSFQPKCWKELTTPLRRPLLMFPTLVSLSKNLRSRIELMMCLPLDICLSPIPQAPANAHIGCSHSINA